VYLSESKPPCSRLSNALLTDSDRTSNSRYNSLVFATAVRSPHRHGGHVAEIRVCQRRIHRFQIRQGFCVLGFFRMNCAVLQFSRPNQGEAHHHTIDPDCRDSIGKKYIKAMFLGFPGLSHDSLTPVLFQPDQNLSNAPGSKDPTSNPLQLCPTQPPTRRRAL
jgi:hypothetical protein